MGNKREGGGEEGTENRSGMKKITTMNKKGGFHQINGGTGTCLKNKNMGIEKKVVILM